MVVDEEIYRRLPTLLIATVDKFAQMPWKGEVQMLFGQVNGFCERHGFKSPDIEDSTFHPKSKTGLPSAKLLEHGPLRPPDLIIQDELHLISGPLGTLVGLYETAIDKLCTWEVNGKKVRPKLIASTATIKNADVQVRSLFLRTVNIFPPPGLDVRDNFFSVQREPTEEEIGRRYLGICAPGRRLKAALIRVYVAYLCSAQALYEKYGKRVDPWMTLVGYFNSMRELGGMRRLVDDDVFTRCQEDGPARVGEAVLRRRLPGRVDESHAVRGYPANPRPPGSNLRSRTRSPTQGGIQDEGLQEHSEEAAGRAAGHEHDLGRRGRETDGPDGGGRSTQGDCRVHPGDQSCRSYQSPGLVCTVFNWARPRDLSHYETFEHYHATFYKHVEPLSVTPFSPGALQRGLAGLLVSLIRLRDMEFNPNEAASRIQASDPYVQDAIKRHCPAC